MGNSAQRNETARAERAAENTREESRAEREKGEKRRRHETPHKAESRAEREKDGNAPGLCGGRVLRGEKISLRPIADADTDAIVRWRNSPAVRANFLDRRLFTPETHRRWLESRVRTGEVAQFVATRLDTGEDVGSAYLRDIDRDNGRAEYGVFLGEESARGLGFGSEACRLLCRYAFEALGLRRVFLRVLADNAGAIRSYEKAGFRREGLLREHVVLDGAPRDLVLMGLLASEFDAAIQEGKEEDGCEWTAKPPKN